jgi:hypothetical protein
MVQRRPDVEGEQAQHQARGYAVDGARQHRFEVGERSRADNGRQRSRDDDRGDAARGRHQHHRVERKVHGPGREFLPVRLIGRERRMAVGDQPPDDAQQGQQQHPCPQRKMRPQQGELGRRINLRGGQQAGGKQPDDHQGGEPVDGDGDAAITGRTALDRHRGLLAFRLHSDLHSTLWI